jgi:hypothetical protein
MKLNQNKGLGNGLKEIGKTLIFLSPILYLSSNADMLYRNILQIKLLQLQKL